MNADNYLRIVKLLICVGAVAGILAAAEPGWKSKPANEWNQDDVQQVLMNSPWTKQVKAVVTRRLTEDQLREAGQMGQPTGVGNEGVDPKGSIRSLPHDIVLKLRWESALPVQIAELRSQTADTLPVEGEGYRIAVYGIPGGGFKGDPKALGRPLKNLAVLKREGKKDVRPISVEVFELESGMAVTYLFPYSAEISRTDRQVRFEAQIGRVVLGQSFELGEMEFKGKLEL